MIVVVSVRFVVRAGVRVLVMVRVKFWVIFGVFFRVRILVIVGLKQQLGL